MFSDFVKPENIILSLESDDKDCLFSEMVENIVSNHPFLDRNAVLSAIENREKQQNTSIKPGIAIPHAICSSVQNAIVAVGISKNGIDYETENGEAVHLVIMMLFEEGNTQGHLKLLADCTAVLLSGEFYTTAMNAKSEDEIIKKIIEIEEAE